MELEQQPSYGLCVCLLYTVSPKKYSPFYFLNNCQKLTIFMIFGMWNPDKIWRQAYRITRERALNVTKNVGVAFLYAAYSSGQWFWIDDSNGKNKN